MLARRRLLLALVATALAAGCGGDDAPQTREGFLAAADAVCADLSSELADAGSTDPKTPQQVAEANDVLADIYGKLADRISDVPLPASGAARREAQAFVNSVRAADPPAQRLRAASEDFVAAARTGDRRQAAVAGNAVRSALDRFRGARAKSDQLAIAYGMTICGSLG